MMAQEKAAGVLDTPEAASQTKRTTTLHPDGVARNPSPAEFTRLQAAFEKRGRQLHRVHRMADVRVAYVINGREQSRHFPTWPDVLAHLAQIGGN